MSDTLQIVQIGDLIQTKNDKSKQLQSSDYLGNGILPIVDQGAKAVCGYTNDLSKRYDKGLPLIIFGDHTLHTKFIDFDFAIGADGTQVLAPKNQECNAKYLYYLISRAAELIGSEGYKRHFKILKEYDVEYIVPLPKQKKIAAILSSVDEVIEKTRAQIDKLKDLKTGMMQELLTKGIGHTEFKDSPVGRIPARWEVVELGKVLTGIDSGWSPNCHDRRPGTGEWGVLKVSSVTRGEFLEDEAKLLPKNLSVREKLLVHKGDILLTRANGVAALVGKCVIVNKEPQAKLMMSDKILRLRPSDKISKEFLLHVFNSYSTRKQIELCWGGSSGQKNISQSDIKDFYIPLPSISEQIAIAKTITQASQVLYDKNNKLAKLISAKKALMQDLLTGKVRVQVDAPEVAEA
ncbi:MAG: restriction endonuclease subunit S [Marinospirillum sp.]|uniref:restriction endonuclease subunit S n=1 Tax=Marinospirillum sp. TaxID=2183934 RepID=UPI0019E51A85|nr:restriction endonuclease subunit S [Marinospirillum sp.]MBE0508934.1 restriction endonuclease subunit S [Marinospirillum sp.]